MPNNAYTYIYTVHELVGRSVLRVRSASFTSGGMVNAKNGYIVYCILYTYCRYVLCICLYVCMVYMCIYIYIYIWIDGILT